MEFAAEFDQALSRITEARIGGAENFLFSYKSTE